LTSRERRPSWLRGRAGPAVLIATAFAFALHAPPADAAPGDLDPSFSHNGKLTIDFGHPRAEGALEVAQLESGKIVVAGFYEADNGAAILIARMRQNGSLDGSFSGDGKAIVNPAGHQGWNAATINLDGSVVVAGGFADDFVVARIRPDGRLDRSFSGDGVAEVDISGYNEASAVVQQTDGKVVVAGPSAPDVGFAIARLERDGSLDPTFSGDGTATPALALAAHALALLPDGEIVAVRGYGHPGRSCGRSPASGRRPGPLFRRRRHTPVRFRSR
jgi:uncharacterized delta-60 repeat protein